MKRGVVTLLALGAAAVAAAVWWRRRRSRASAPAVRLGLADGAVRTLDLTDPATAGLPDLAAGVRDSLTGGA